MPVVTDPQGVQWSVHRRLWPFPDLEDLLDNFDFFGWVIGLVLVLPLLVLWPVWFLAKLLGVRWVLVVERDHVEVERELVRGWRRSGVRSTELAAQLAQGWRSGNYAL
ncbi:hypothetical protein BST22_04375 [Mycolicibacterium chubuense]|uniref:Uncharacterized protein n=1 Tax=Mycolicibacterium chubuense TaxID=1800 RepID=A0A0J6ZJA0_MYCCU|nr:hypothetical protein [Mycolicibacterium chubuense]KMO84986.1 hypothetical protein MCHUDSM44219_00085 [Mycolicibacterium chubuense]ORA55753.1 hypothetical protein BST22_04375 [Mycolicibacterium chubuense]SPX95550.1 Uncharacterised protein [Mycolicibacterium chubuense]